MLQFLPSNGSLFSCFQGIIVLVAAMSPLKFYVHQERTAPVAAQYRRCVPPDIITKRLAVGRWRSACHAQLAHFVRKALAMRQILALQVLSASMIDFNCFLLHNILLKR